MKPLFACIALLGFTALAVAEAPTLKDARLRWLKGNYEEARTKYLALAKDAKQRVPAAIGLSKTWESQGKHDEAIKSIETPLKQEPKSAALLARQAELLYLVGRRKDAEAAAGKALAIQKDNYLARWIRAQVYRDRGDTDKADAEWKWFFADYNDRVNTDQAVTDPEALVLAGLALTERANWHSAADDFDVILTDIYSDAANDHKNYWPVEYQAGMLLLEKYNRPEAEKAFDKVLTINPQAAPALAAKGELALQNYEISEADKFADRALKINPNLMQGLLLKADVYQLSGNTKAAREVLDKARKINARDERTLGRLAACMLLDKKQKDFDALVKEVGQNNTKPGLFYHCLAERLNDRRQYEAARGYYKKAIEQSPMLPWPRNSLGLLHMRLGEEEEGRAVLKKAREADAFNVRVTNTLKVLAHLEKYQTQKTEHFLLRFDPKTDKVLARFMADFLEDMYADLARKFQYKPSRPILVEIFNTHDMFSGRIVALPDLHTIGASTGRMFAMVSPRGRGIAKPFNWARVLRHELVHIFNLEQTHFQVTHWLTEGLAVENEGFPMPSSWHRMLGERVARDKLLNLDTIDLGFIRPRSPEEWQLAYCQSLLYVKYMKQMYGADCVGKMLAAYRDDLGTEAALLKVCKVKKADFEKGYRAYLDNLVKGFHGKPVEKEMTLAELKKAHEKEPDNADLAARLAEQYLQKRRNVEARKLVDAVLAKHKKHPRASCVKAKLKMQAGEEDEALKLLEAALDAKQPDLRVLETLAEIYTDAKKYAKAAAILEQAQKAQPQESRWLVELASVYAQTGDKAKQIALLKKLVPTDADDLDVRKRLAQMLLDTKQYADAEKYAREALEIDVLDKEVQGTLQKALAAQKKTAEVAKLKKMLE